MLTIFDLTISKIQIPINITVWDENEVFRWPVRGSAPVGVARLGGRSGHFYLLVCLSAGAKLSRLELPQVDDDVHVDFLPPTQVGEVAPVLEVRSPRVRVQLVEFVPYGLTESARVEHLWPTTLSVSLNAIQEAYIH